MEEGQAGLSGCAIPTSGSFIYICMAALVLEDILNLLLNYCISIKP